MNAKLLRSTITNRLFNFFDKMKIPNNILAFIIKSYHFHYPFYSLIFIILFPIPLACIQLLLCIISFLCYIYFDGCILTILEYKLNNKKDDIHIIDFLLHSLQYEITNENRINVTIIVAGYYFILVFFILWIRIMNFKKN